MRPAADLTSAPIPSLIRRLAVPAGTGFFFNTMFNVVDTWYGGKLSTTALAAMSLSFPMFFIILAIGAGISSGATTLIGNALGRGDHDEAQRYILQSFSFTLIHAVALTTLGLICSPSIFRSMGADGEYLSLALGYINVIFVGVPFFMFNFTVNAILNSYGDTVSYRNFLVTGFFLNLTLDPWLMYGGMGIPALYLPGVALATVVVQGLGTIYLLGRLRRSGVVRPFHTRDLLPRRHSFGELFRQGFPAALNMMTVTLGVFIITWFVAGYGKEAVAAYGIGTRIEQIALLPVMGLNVSTLALAAQNYGAGRIGRIRQMLGISLGCGFLLAALGTMAALLFTGALMAAFTADAAVIAAGVRFLRIEAFVFPAYVLLYLCVSAMQGIRRPLFGLWVGLYRQIAAPFAVFHLLTTMAGWGIMGIWWGIFMVTWSAALLVVVHVTRTLKKLHGEPSP